MFMRSACIAIGLFGCVAAARADWQPVEPPPVPPETENAQRTREQERADDRPQPTPAIGSPTRAEQEPPASRSASQQAASPEGFPTGAAASPSTGAPPPSAAATPVRAGSSRVGELAQANAPRRGSDAEALTAFPPAPPPVVPGAAPEQPNTALTSFAPAPAPTQKPTAAAPKPNAPPADAATAAPAPVTAPVTPPAKQTTTAPVAADGGVDVRAPAPRSTELWSAAALFGVGATFDNTVAGVNPLGFGFGVRGDYRIHPMWSLGARLVYFVGGSVELPTHDVVMQSWLLAAEGAYVLDLDPLTIQPGLALGLYVRETNYRGFAPVITEDPTSVSQPDTTRLFFYLAPGLNVSLPLALATPALAPLTMGADVRLDVGFGRRVTGSIQLLGQLGLRF